MFLRSKNWNVICKQSLCRRLAALQPLLLHSAAAFSRSICSTIQLFVTRRVDGNISGDSNYSNNKCK